MITESIKGEKIMVQICETVMLICFGLSWPISVYKSITTKSTKGKSPIFLLAVIIGYIAGIIGKIIGGNLNYVLVLYLINLTVVTADFIIYFINLYREKPKKQKIKHNKNLIVN